MVGVARSGTTLLRVMLDAHPALAVPPETHFIHELARAMKPRWTSEDAVSFLTAYRRWSVFGLDPEALRERAAETEGPAATAATRAFFELYAAERGKPRWGDKTPPYVNRMPAVQRVVPEARFIHLIRDGRAVALSLKDAYFGPDTAAGTAARWAKRIRRARSQAAKVEHYLEVRYEDLVTEPERVLRRVLDFAGLDWDESVLRYHEGSAAPRVSKMREIPRRDGTMVSPEAQARLHTRIADEPTTDRIDRWREELTAAELRDVEREAGEMLVELGYL